MCSPHNSKSLISQSDGLRTLCARASRPFVGFFFSLCSTVTSPWSFLFGQRGDLDSWEAERKIKTTQNTHKNPTSPPATHTKQNSTKQQQQPKQKHPPTHRFPVSIHWLYGNCVMQKKKQCFFELHSDNFSVYRRGHLIFEGNSCRFLLHLLKFCFLYILFSIVFLFLAVIKPVLYLKCRSMLFSSICNLIQDIWSLLAWD